MKRSAAILLGLLAFAALALAFRYVPYMVDARAVSATAQRVSDQMEGLDPGSVDRPFVERLRSEVADLRSRTVRLQDLLQQDPLVHAARDIPALQPTLADADAVLAAGAELVVAADLALQVGDRFVALRETGTAGEGSVLAGMVELMATSGDDVDEIDRRIDMARAALDRISPDAAGEIRRAADLMRAPLEKYGPLLDRYRRADDILPDVLGWDGERRYLVLAQNPAELRPTGGYTGTVGVVTFRRGDLVEQDFVDVYELDLKPGIPFVEPPEALQDQLLGTASWQLADANWSPDFPTAAQDALRLYTLESGDDRVDGVIALTTYAIDRLLEVTGPVSVLDYGVTVRPGDTTLTALSLTRGISTPTSDRKAFLDSLASTLLERLYALPPSGWIPLFDALDDITQRRLLLAWMKDQDAQGLLLEGAIAGAVRQEPDDYLYVVEANVAPTSKYNLVVSRRTHLEVGIEPDGSTENGLRLVWQNDSEKPGEPYASIRSYSTSTEGFYGAYVRVLAPAGSQLTDAAGQGHAPITDAESVAPEAGHSSFANYLLMPPGASELRYTWRVPAAAHRLADEWLYRLTIQKQPGMVAEPVSVTVTLPPGAEISTIPEGATVSGLSVVWTTVLTVDATIEIGYRLP